MVPRLGSSQGAGSCAGQLAHPPTRGAGDRRNLLRPQNSAGGLEALPRTPQRSCPVMLHGQEFWGRMDEAATWSSAQALCWPSPSTAKRADEPSGQHKDSLAP